MPFEPIITLIRLIMTDANERQRNNEVNEWNPHANYTFSRQCSYNKKYYILHF